MGTMAVSISIGITAEGGEPGSTPGEGQVIDEDSGIDTYSRVRSSLGDGGRS